MNWFLNLTTKIKLSIGFGILFLLIVVMYLNTQMQLDTLWQNQKAQYEVDHKAITSILHIRGGIANIRLGAITALATSSSSKSDESNQNMAVAIEQTQNELATFDTLITKWKQGDLVNYSIELKNRFSEFVKTAQDVLRLLSTNQTEQAKKIIFSIQKERFAKIDALINKLYVITDTRISEKIKNSEQAYSTAIILSIILGLFAALFSIAAIFVFNKIISAPLNKIVTISSNIATGDLSVALEKNGNKDEFGLMTTSFNTMLKSLRNMIQDVSETINVLSSSSIQISSSSSQLAASANETATSVTETTSTVEEVRQTSNITNAKAKQVAESSQRATQASAIGKKYTDETIEGINKVGTQMETIADSIIKLSEQSRAISDIISTVNDLAEQTNLLAVNASIEAARAGEQGKGFVVVAQEIKSLADQSKQATSQVKTILNDIQHAIGAAVMATEQGSKMVEAGIKQSTQTGNAILSITESINEASQLAVQISASSQEQSVGMDQVALAMENIKYASVQNAQTTKQLETSAQSLKDMGTKLKELVQNYKV